MNPDIARAALVNHVRSNTRFMRPTPRTCREAFGGGFSPAEQDRLPAWVVVGLFLAAAALILFWGFA